MVICRLHVDCVWTLLYCLRGVVNRWLRTSRASSFLASKVLNSGVAITWSGHCYFTVDCQEYKLIPWGQGTVQVWGCDDMLSLRNFGNLFRQIWYSSEQYECPDAAEKRKNNQEHGAAKRVTMAYAVTRFYRQRGKLLNCLKSWHDCGRRVTIGKKDLEGLQVVMKSWHD